MTSDSFCLKLPANNVLIPPDPFFHAVGAVRRTTGDTTPASRAAERNHGVLFSKGRSERAG